jgi:hypothetical protein
MLVLVGRDRVHARQAGFADFRLPIDDWRAIENQQSAIGNADH